MGSPAAEPGSPDSAPSDSATIAGSFERPERFGAIFDRHYTAVHRYLARRTAAPRPTTSHRRRS